MTRNALLTSLTAVYATSETTRPLQKKFGHFYTSPDGRVFQQPQPYPDNYSRPLPKWLICLVLGNSAGKIELNIETFTNTCAT